MAFIVCDTGVLIAAERLDRAAGRLGLQAAKGEIRLVVPAPCVAQAWRSGARQVRLVRFLASCDELPFTPTTARAAGELLAATGASVLVDAAVVLAARPGDVVLTGDPDDLEPLAAASPARPRVVAFG